MSTPTLPFADLEVCYDKLAEAIDAVGPERESVYLSKLVLCLAHELGDLQRILAIIDDCLHEPDPNEPGLPRPI